MNGRRHRPRRLEQLGAMAAGLAHEVRNPLSTMTVNLQLMAEDFATPQTPAEERTLRRANLLLGEVRRLDGIVADFLELARGYELELQTVDLELLVIDLLRFFEPENRRLGIEARSSLEPAARLVTADPKFLRLALNNLVVNAQQAMSESGGELLLETRMRDRLVEIAITDTGSGIPADKLEKIFMPFWSSKQGGTGLGLPMTRRIIEECGGRVAVHSEPGRGTRITVTVPKPPEQLPGGEDAESGA